MTPPKMKNCRLGALIVTMAVTASSLLGAPRAAADTTTETEKIQAITNFEPGTSVEDAIAYLAEDQGLSRADAIDALYQSIEESNAAAPQVATPPSDRPTPVASATAASSGSGSPGDGCARSHYLPEAAHIGDYFVVPSYFAYKNHGHAGIYSAPYAIVEALGPGKKSQSRYASTFKPCDGGGLYAFTGATPTQRTKAGKIANDALRGREYNVMWWRNRKDATPGGSALNCSELVWIAYKAVDRNFDIHGSNSHSYVLPVDLTNARHVVMYKKL